MENNKLNAQIVIKCTSYEKEKIQNISKELGISVNKLCRAILNQKVDELLYRGVKSFTMRLIEVGKPKKQLD